MDIPRDREGSFDPKLIRRYQTRRSDFNGLSGFPQAIETVYPRTQVQLCIVHMVRNSLTYVSWRDRKQVAKDLRAVDQAATAEQAEAALDRFVERWDEQYSTISRQWRGNSDHLTLFLAFPQEIRKVIY